MEKIHDVLSGDIGATNTRLAVYSTQDEILVPLFEKNYPSASYNNLEEIIREFLAEKAFEISLASFGAAGPVENGRVKITNLPWQMDAAQISRGLGGIPVSLINDLEAIANAIPFLDEGDLEVINPGDRNEGGTLAVFAPGTGLGVAYLVWNGARYMPCPSEGGHSGFGPSTEIEADLAKYILGRYGYAGCERVCSGLGIPNLYNFITSISPKQESPGLLAKIRQAEDPTPIIVDSALAGKSAICEQTLDLFISIFGSEAGNLALTILSTGGLFLAGGIAPRLIPQLRSGLFMESFTRNDRMSDLLKKIPVHVVTNARVGMIGAVYYALQNP